MKKEISPSNHELTLRPIAYIHTDFPSKFGIPRQSGLVSSLHGTIIFEPEYQNPDALRGLEEYSHIWLIWEFSESIRGSWSPTVRPPRLGGNQRKGVFATRSPFRPNPLGLSSVKLESIEWNTPHGAVLHVLGADLMDKTPIYDIKPYLPYVDSHEDATGGFAHLHKDEKLEVIIPNQWQAMLSPQDLASITGILQQDPRPAYQKDPERIYGFSFSNMEIRFTVKEKTAVIQSIEFLK